MTLSHSYGYGLSHEGEAKKKLLARVSALIAHMRLKQAEREALAEAKQADTPSAEPFLTTAEWLSVASIAASLAEL